MDFQLNLEGDSVQEARPIEPLCVGSQMSISQVMLLMKQHDTGSALICKDEKLIGIFTERDVIRILASGVDLEDKIETAMIKDPVVLTKADTIATAIQKMNQGHYRHLPVVDENNCPNGMLKVRGIVHYLVEHFPSTIYNLPPDPRPIVNAREGA